MKGLLTAHIISLCLGTLLDQLVGDPQKLPHPVRAIGKLIATLEDKLYPKENVDGKTMRRRGMLLWFATVTIVTVITLFMMIVSYKAGMIIGIAAESVLTAYILASRSLYRESMAVASKLEEHDTAGARHALSMIVGRDTDELAEEEIIKAAVETVAENASDGVIAPFIYAAVGGPVFGMFYKAVNTMDSMIGYHNSRYEDFGFFAARADDVFNLVPSRISAVMMIAGCAILSFFSKDYDAKSAYRIYMRDRRCHTSPNSAQTESVCAGSLGLMLGGTHMYKNKPVEKPMIGDAKRGAQPGDIKRANTLMFAAQALTTLIALAILLTVNFL